MFNYLCGFLCISVGQLGLELSKDILLQPREYNFGFSEQQERGVGLLVGGPELFNCIRALVLLSGTGRKYSWKTQDQR